MDIRRVAFCKAEDVWSKKYQFQYVLCRKKVKSLKFSCSVALGYLDLYLYSKSMKTQHLYFRYLSNMDLVHQHFVFIRELFFIYSIKWSVFVLIGCQYALFKSTCYKTSYLTPCNIPHEWFEFLHRALLADWVDYIFPTSKFRYSFSISKY